MNDYKPQDIPENEINDRLVQLRHEWCNGIRFAYSQDSPGFLLPIVALATGLPNRATADRERSKWSDTYRALRGGALAIPGSPLVGLQLLIGHLDLQHPVKLFAEEEQEGWAVWTTVGPQAFPDYLASVAIETWSDLVLDLIRGDAPLDLSDAESFSNSFGVELNRRLSLRPVRRPPGR